jgi:hypothetical protein
MNNFPFKRINLLAVALHPFGDTLGAKSIAPDRGLIENRIRQIPLNFHGSQSPDSAAGNAQF